MTSEKPFKNIFSTRWWIYLPFVIGLGVLAFIVWVTLKAMVYPHDGISNISQGGVITFVEPSGPTYNKLSNDDQIITVDGIHWEQVHAPYKDKRAGDKVDFLIARGDQMIPVTASLVDPPLGEILVRLVPILVALVFWGLGMGVQTFKPKDGAANIFFAWCMVCAMTLAAGVASYLEAIWTSVLFSSLFRVIGPLSVHFHMDFPQVNSWRSKKLILIVLYSIAFLGILSYLYIVYTDHHHDQWIPFISSVGRIYLGVNLLIVVGLLLYQYTHAASPGAKAKVRLVALGGGLSGLSIVVFTILPDGLFHQPILSYSFAFLLLAIIPLTYGYAIFRYHLIEIEDRVNRVATDFLIYAIIGGAYLIFYAFLSKALPKELATFPLLNAFVLLLLISLFNPLRTWIQRFVDTMFYGHWYDYRVGIMNLTQGLDEVPDLNSLATIVGERLVSTLNLEESCAFLRIPDGNFSVIEVASRSDLAAHPPRVYPVLPRSSLTYLLKIGAVERNNLKKALSEITVTPEELQLLNSEQIHLWVPIIGHEQILGLLALGPKLGGDVFSKDDLDIMRLLVRQLGPVIEKLNLLTRLREYAAGLEQRVTDRTAELFNAKERVEAILSSVGDGVIVTDLDGKIIRANPSFEKQSGYFASEIIGRELNTLLVRTGEGHHLFEEITTALNTRGVWSGDLTTRRKSGDCYDIRLFIAPVHDQNGNVVGYVGSQIDITRQKELERMKDTFIADVSHELRTPTTNISLYLELLERAPAHKQPYYVTVLKEQTQQLVKLVEDILDLSRLARSNETKKEFAKIDLNLLIEQIVQSSQALAVVSGIALKFDPGSRIPFLIGDQNQISRLVSNLVMNAIRYTKEGEVSLHTFSTGRYVCLTVRDTGIGIHEDDLPHIFERFYRGKNVRQSNTPGTGLGLAIVREIVDGHRGRIEVSSIYGKGSIFEVQLPAEGVENG